METLQGKQLFVGLFALKIRKKWPYWGIFTADHAVFTLCVYQPTSTSRNLSAHIEPILGYADIGS